MSLGKIAEAVYKCEEYIFLVMGYIFNAAQRYGNLFDNVK